MVLLEMIMILLDWVNVIEVGFVSIVVFWLSFLGYCLKDLKICVFFFFWLIII